MVKDKIKDYKAIIELMKDMHKLDIVLEYQEKIKKL